MKTTWRITIGIWLALTLASIIVGSSHALTANPIVPPMVAPKGLALLEMKITGDEFIVLQNNSGAPIADLSSYWLTVYNNVNPLSAGVSSSTQQLPSSSLLAGQTLLLSANPMATCGATVAGKLSVSLGDSGGFMQLAQSSLDAKGAVSQLPVDVASWSSTASGIIQNIPSNTKDPKATFYRYLSGNSYIWQLADSDATNACQLNIVVAGGSGSSSAVTPLTLAATSPPATILGTVTAASDADIASLPSADVGLTAPQLSELVPNPSGTGNDGTDEYIELYNPNGVAFDLSGFMLQTGLTTTHSYTFPAGSMLAPGSFKAFYPTETGLSLSNTSGQATLLDPLGNTISSTEAYGTAKDGLAWALASGKWYWTTQPTPGLANIIKQPAVKKSKTATASNKKTTKSSAKKKTTTKLASNATAATQDTGDDAASTTPIHSWVLALVATGALLYGLYEYRRDLANRIYQLATKFGLRRRHRPAAAGSGND